MCGKGDAETMSPGDGDALALLRLAPVVICDVDLCIRYWSMGAERLYGWSAGTMRLEMSYTHCSQPNSPNHTRKFVLICFAAHRGVARFNTGLATEEQST